MAFLMVVLRSKAGIALLVALLCAAVAGWEGYQSGSERVQRLWDAEKARTAAGIIKSVEVQDARNNLAATRYEVKREYRSSAFRSIRRHVDRLPVADCSMSDDGLRIWNAANANADAADVPGQPDGEVSDVADGDQREAGRPDQ